MPTGAVVDEKYPSTFATIGEENGFVAGLWNNRNAAANNGPVLIHGTTTLGGRYMFYNTNAFSRVDGQREWLYFVQTALWSNLTDEVTLDNGKATQSVQYSDAVETIAFSANDANASGSALSAAAPGLPAGLTLTKTSDNGGTTPGAASWTISGAVTAPAGTYPVTVTVSDGGARAVGKLAITITVTQEDAALLYNGSVAIPAGTTPTLGAQFWDSAAAGFPGPNPESGGTKGDMTQAWVRFAVTSASGSTIGTAQARVADTGTVGDGIGSASLVSPYKSSSDAVWLVTSSIVKDSTGATPNLFYAAPVDETGLLIFYADTGQYATGGGTVPDGASKANFGFVARYNKSGNPQGQVVYLFRGTYKGVPATFKIKSNSLDGLAFSGTSYPVSATLSGKCSISIVDSRDAVLFGEGNWRFTSSVTDVDKGAGSDAFSVTIWNKDNELYKKMPSTALAGGSIVIHNPKIK